MDDRIIGSAFPAFLFLAGNKFGDRSHVRDICADLPCGASNMALLRPFHHSGALFPCPVDSG
jgi:hypothetical protein